jgi:phosphomethylpyrimidine synthase
MTQLEKARKGLVTEEMKICAAQEGVEPEYIRQGMVDGNIVVCRNVNHTAIQPLAIGLGLRTKVNANIGTSKDNNDLNLELEKLQIATAAGADAVMDLSTGGDLAVIRKAIMEKATVAIGTVPIYQAAVKILQENTSIADMPA